MNKPLKQHFSSLEHLRQHLTRQTKPEPLIRQLLWATKLNQSMTLSQEVNLINQWQQLETEELKAKIYIAIEEYYRVRR